MGLQVSPLQAHEHLERKENRYFSGQQQLTPQHESIFSALAFSASADVPLIARANSIEAIKTVFLIMGILLNF
jgi:hypothetical protein